MKYWLLLLASCSLYADNEYRLWLGCRVEVNPDNVVPKLTISFYPFNPDPPDTPPNIVVTSKPVIKTLADLVGKDFVDASFTITAIPDALTLQGYLLAVNLLTMYIDLNVQSPLFEKFRLFPLTGTRASILNANFVDTNIWFQRVTSETFSTGIQVSHTWTNDNAILSAKPVKKTVDFTLRLSTLNIGIVEPGVYWMQLTLGMDPFTETPNQKAIIASEIITEITALTDYIDQIDGILTEQNTLHTLSDVQIAVLNANKKALAEQRSAIIKANQQ